MAAYLGIPGYTSRFARTRWSLRLQGGESAEVAPEHVVGSMSMHHEKKEWMRL